MVRWTKRNPRPSIMFHTKRDRDLGFGLLATFATDVFPMKDVISIKVTNSMNASAGTFEINLVYYAINSDAPYYYTAIQPLDVVDIALDGVNTTMIGIVDRVRKRVAIQNGAARASVSIVGRAAGSIWDFDLVRYFENALGLSKDLQQKSVLLQQGAIAFEFLQKPTSEAIIKIHENLPAFNMSFRDKVLSDFLNVGDEIFVRPEEKIFNTQLSPYQGSVWTYFKKYISPPFNEMWTESRDGKLFLRARPTPFSLTDTEKGVSPSGESRTFGWNEITNWIDGERGHIIEDSDIREEEFDYQHGNAYSVFTVLPSDKFTSGNIEYATFPPLIDSDLVKEIGVRDMQLRLNYIPLLEGQETDGTLQRYRFYRNKAYLWFRDNHRMESGSVTIMANPNIRVGDKVIMDSTGHEFYTTFASHQFTYGQPHTTTLKLSRGLHPDTRKQLYSIGSKFIGDLQGA